MLFIAIAIDSPAHAQRLIELARTIGARVGGVEQKMNIAAPGRSLDLLAAGDQGAGARLEPEPVEQGLAQRGLDAGAEIVGYDELAGLERAGQRALQAPFRLRLLEPRAVDADPGAAARSARTHVGRDLAVGPERQPDQDVACAVRAREHAFALGLMVTALLCAAATPGLRLGGLPFDGVRPA
jgi:hypothetical protein